MTKNIILISLGIISLTAAVVLTVIDIKRGKNKKKKIFMILLEMLSYGIIFN